mgnify:CR=1 FL=1|jgi:hypothetical protein
MVFINTKQSLLPPSEAIDIDTAIAAADADYSDEPIRRVSIGVAGDLKVDMPNATGVVIDANALVIGVQHEMIITKVYKVGTTATQVWGWR